MSKISDLQYDYLAEIRQIAQLKQIDDQLVTSAELAERLQTSQSTVNRVIERLRDKNLIQHERYVGVKLTEQGADVARAILRKQAIIEAFLVAKMGFGWHEIYDEARRLRHGTNNLVLQRMWDLSGQPAQSPFGEWIDLPLHGSKDQLLTSVDSQVEYRLARVLVRQPDRLSYLAALGLQPGAPLYLLHKAPFNGPLQIRMGHEYRIVGYELAQMLTVTVI